MKKKNSKSISFPHIATLAYYGPDNKTVSKIVVSIVAGSEIIDIKKWFPKSPDIDSDPELIEDIANFIKQNHVQKVARTEQIIGCPHEEGIDYPEGTTCPACPFWANKNRWEGIEIIASEYP